MLLDHDDYLSAAIPGVAALTAALLLSVISLPAAIVQPITDVYETAIVPTVVTPIIFRPEKRSETDLIPSTDTGWPRVLRTFKAEPPAVLAWAEASETERYLCEVYWRVPEKKDRSGIFTWKDRVAAERRGMGVCQYAIGGLNPSFKETLARLGERLDEAGLNWSMLSAFRDDYRQSIASGFKARGGNSLHGGSRATKGYGDGRAIDITVSPVTELYRVFQIVDTFGRSLGLQRPMPRYDAAHIQSGGSRQVASKKRKQRVVRVKKNETASNSNYASNWN